MLLLLAARSCLAAKCVILDFLLNVWLLTDAAIDPVRVAVPALGKCLGALLKSAPSLFAPPAAASTASVSSGSSRPAGARMAIRIPECAPRD